MLLLRIYILAIYLGQTLHGAAGRSFFFVMKPTHFFMFQANIDGNEKGVRLDPWLVSIYFLWGMWTKELNYK